ncbi:MAG TPA: NYN domain-containing protein, partial [Pseudomonadales bacterium]|nr:NYN domain-containing protein [Pseudomonadales bacterium]
MDKNTVQVAVFIDYDNIEISVNDVMGRDAQVEWSRVLQVATQMGRVVLRRAYADWALSADRQRELLAQGVELIHVNSRRGKNAADIRIVIDALELLFGEQSGFTHVLLVSGDGDFTELVHRLRAYGKVVFGLGVSGTSAEYLVNACDKFLYYDKLPGVVKPEPKPKKPVEQVHNNSKPAPAPVEPVQPAVITPEPEVKPEPKPEPEPAAPASPDAIYDQYLHILAKQKIRMTPTEHRPSIIFKFHELCRANPGISLTHLTDKVRAYYTENPPHVDGQFVTETVHQLFHTYCFEFQKEPGIERLWDQKVSLAPDIARSTDLMEKCDRGVLQKLVLALGGPDKVDKEVAARILYGGVRGQRMLDHIGRLLES